MVAALIISVIAGRVGAQEVREVRISDANGQFALWIDTPKRPDDNYTNGAQLFVSLASAPLWHGIVARHTPVCGTPADSAGHACASTDFRFGQDIYTPHTALMQTGDPIVGQRPYAGWLYLAGTGRVATPRRSNAVTLEAGVTGPPSLGQAIQTAWHGAIGFPAPLGWSHQIPFEPGILLGYAHEQEIVQVRADDVPILSLVPYGAVSAGNVLTGATVGVDSRIGYAVTTPWAGGDPRHPGRVQVYLVAGAREDWVGYNLFLDHSTTNPALHVDKRPWVTQFDFGVGARFWKLEAELLGIDRAREYATGPATEPYAIVSVGWRGVR